MQTGHRWDMTVRERQDCQGKTIICLSSCHFYCILPGIFTLMCRHYNVRHFAFCMITLTFMVKKSLEVRHVWYRFPCLNIVSVSVTDHCNTPLIQRNTTSQIAYGHGSCFGLPEEMTGLGTRLLYMEPSVGLFDIVTDLSLWYYSKRYLAAKLSPSWGKSNEKSV